MRGIKALTKGMPYMQHHKFLDSLSFILVVIGGICLGLFGAFGIDVIGSLFGAGSGFTRLVYILIGLSAVYRVIMWAKARK